MKGNASNAYMQQGKLLPRRFQWNEGLDRPYLLSPGEREHTVTLPDHFSILIAITGSEIGASTNFSFAVPSVRILARRKDFGL